MPTSMHRNLNITVDARALQDPGYRNRGVGHHGLTMIEQLRQKGLKDAAIILSAIIDPSLPELEYSQEMFFDRVTKFTDRSQGSDIHINLSPMTHDSMFGVSPIVDRAALRVALFYDMIPLEFPHWYLTTGPTRVRYLSNLIWLTRYDLVACISEFTARRLGSRIPLLAERTFATGIAIRAALHERPVFGVQPTHSQPDADTPTILIAGGGDPRKNVEFAVGAVAELGRTACPRVNILGKYAPDQKAELRLGFFKKGGTASELRFLEDMPDAELGAVYREATLVIVPSFAEGFSMPILEASHFGVPVLASRIGAHMELLGESDALFSPDDEEELKNKLAHYLAHDANRGELRKQQSGLGQRFSSDNVAQLFLDRLNQAAERFGAPRPLEAPAVRKHAKPKVAFFTPLRPQPSGISDYSAALVPALAARCDLTIASDAVAAPPLGSNCSVSPIEAMRSQYYKFDHLIYAFGNSGFHLPIVDFALQYPGAGIFHDVRMLDFYYAIRGPEAAVELARVEGVENASLERIHEWLRYPRRMETYFLSELMNAADPAIVHSRRAQELLSKKYSKPVAFLPFAVYRAPNFSEAEFIEQRRAARQALEHDGQTIFITTFGIVGPEKCPSELLWAVKILSDWGVSFRLTFCGTGAPAELAAIRSQALELGISDRVILFKDAPDERLFRSYLLGSDICVQLRNHSMGTPSGALSDAIAFALPAVAPSDLADALDAPPFVARIPNEISPLLVAEAIMSGLAAGDDVAMRLETAKEYLARHSPENYVRELLDILSNKERS